MRTWEDIKQGAKEVESEIVADIRKEAAETADPLERARLTLVISEMFERLSDELFDLHCAAVCEAYPNTCDPLGHFDTEHGR